jgi:ABC-2 type transport system ATP-binding protein
VNACTSPDRPTVEVLHLCKSYGETAAADDVSFSVAEGEIFGILGPNGAGKTTTIECVLGLQDGVARNRAVIAFPGYIRRAWRTSCLFPRLLDRAAPPRQIRDMRSYRTVSNRT